MKKSIEVREYKMSDADLIQLADEILDLTVRDAAEFVTKGWDNARLATVSAAREDFNDYPSDEKSNSLRQKATDEKNKARDLLEEATRNIFVAVDNRYDDASDQNLFGHRDLARLTDNQLHRRAKLIYEAVNEHQADLVSEGITAAVVSAYNALASDFDLKIDRQRKSENDRNAEASKRVELGNKLYRLLIKVCNVGKVIWYSVNEAKYNDYVIYDVASNTVPSTASATLAPGDTGTYFSGQLQIQTRFNISITAGMDKLAIYVADNKQGALPTNAAYALPLKPQDLTAGDISNGTLGNCFVVNIGNSPISFTLTLL